MNKWYKRGVCLLLLLALTLPGCAGPANPPEQTQDVAAQPSETAEPQTEATEETKGEEPTMPPEQTTFYCAVGTVDETAKTARVLFGNGEVATIHYEGEAPVAGTVNPFTREGDVYTAQKIRVIPPYGGSLKGRTPVTVSARQKRFWYTMMYFVDNDSVFFVRYSPTEWRVFRGRDALATDGETMIYLYAEAELDGLARVVRYGMVVGDYAEAGQWPPADKANTAFLDPLGEGWDSGDIDLS